MWFLGLSLPMILVGLAVRCLIIFGILPVHEYAHARMAYALGDDTASLKGRMTLNPLAHIDWVGALCIMVIGFGWAKPVPVNPYNFTNRKHVKRGMALTALAGPMSNLIFALIAMIIFRLICCFSGVGLTEAAPFTNLNNFCVFGGKPYIYNQTFEIIHYIFFTLITINISLAVFNLIPIPPLDGSKILSAFIPDRTLYKISEFTRKYSMYIMIAFFAIIYTGILDKPLAWMGNTIFNGLWICIDWLFDLVGLGVASIG